MNHTKRPIIWLVKDAEPLPFDPKQRRLRTGMLAEELHRRGYNIVWFASRFEHARKIFIPGNPIRVMKDGMTIRLLEGPGYKRNISLSRILHQRAVANDFLQQARNLEKPDLILAACPSPELCHAACLFGKENGIPVYIDARDPWPDSFAEYFPKYLRWVISPVVGMYRSMLRAAFQSAAGVISISRNMLEWSLSYSGRAQGPNDAIFYLGYRTPIVDGFAAVPQKFSAEIPLRIAFVATFGKSYDIKTVLEALRIVNTKNPGHVECLFIGEGSTLDDLSVEERSIPGANFLGWKDGVTLRKILAGVHVGLIAIRGGVSKFWIGNKLFEYSAHRLAVINSAPEEVAAIIKNSDFGINISKENPADLALAIERYLIDPMLLSKHRVNSADIFFKEFAAEIIYPRYADHITRDISSRLEAQQEYANV